MVARSPGGLFDLHDDDGGADDDDEDREEGEDEHQTNVHDVKHLLVVSVHPVHVHNQTE